RLASSPTRLVVLTRAVPRAAAALAHAFAPAAPGSILNEPISSERHLAMVSRPLAELREIKRRYRSTVNDVVLAVCAGAARQYLQGQGERPTALKAMVPVSVRRIDDRSVLGNRIAFMFMALPCEESDPVRRLLEINRITRHRKHSGEPEGADA